MGIERKVKKLIKKHVTNDPFKLCKLLGIIVVFEQLGSTYGYYSKTHSIKVIHINNDLPYLKQVSTCAHELGHAVKHPDENSAFMKAHTYFSTDKKEREANEFMIDLLFNQELVEPVTDWEVIEGYGIPRQLLPIKFRNIKKI